MQMSIFHEWFDTAVRWNDKTCMKMWSGKFGMACDEKFGMACD